MADPLNVATRFDVQTEVERLRGELHAEIKALRAELREMRARLDGVARRIGELEHRRLMTKAYVFGLVIAGIIVAAVHYWPPAHSP